MSPPAVIIRLEFEHSPAVVFDYLSGDEEQRMALWLAGHADYLELVDRALELCERERAA